MELDAIQTEQRNEHTAHIDEVSTEEIVKLINLEDQKVAGAVEAVLPQVAAAAEIIYKKLRDGGRLVYSGCGTSGRLGVLDAAECPPTYGTDPKMVVALIAGGKPAFTKAVEGAEDNRALGREDLEKIGFSRNDVLVGIAASGRTPYVLGAMEYAHSVGAPVIALTCCPGSQVDRLADIGIAPSPGPEVIAGSTRMKSGTAQKMVLNMLSTTVMIKLGKVYGNLMVDVKASNKKLIGRAVSIVATAAGVTREEAHATLAECGFSSKTAIVMLECGMDAQKAADALEESGGRISDVIRRYGRKGAR